jgi:mannose-6-phosphate isomerase-like protein (cupin superfamily)
MASSEFDEGIRIKSLPLGNVQVTVGKETKRVKSGDVFVVPPKTNHRGRIFGDRIIAVSCSPVG